MGLNIRAIERGDFASWWPLFAAYCDFYKVTPDRARAEVVFTEFFAAQPALHALLAEVDGEVVGFAHYRRYFESLSAAFEVNLDDLFVSPERRAQGLGQALIEAVCRAASDREATLVRWITAADNVTAQRLYDQLAKRTSWVTYEIEL